MEMLREYHVEMVLVWLFFIQLCRWGLVMIRGDSGKVVDSSFSFLMKEKNNWPLLEFYLNWCSENLKGFSWPIFLPQQRREEQAIEHIERAVGQILINLNDRKALASKMMKAGEDLKINDSDLKWLKENKRACYWFWEKIRWLKVLNNISNPNILEYIIEKNTLYVPQNSSSIDFIRSQYELIGISITPSDHAERYDLIKKFFELWFCNLKVKRGFYEEMKQAWNNKGFEANFNWLSMDNEESCEMAWEYIRDQTTLTLSKNKPTSVEDCYWMVYLAYDFSSEHPAEKRTTAGLMSRAWSQRKYRSKQHDKKALNTHISVEAKEKLDRIVRLKGKKIPEAIEELIAAEFERITKHQ